MVPDKQQMIIVLFHGGCCGDLVTTVIDDRFAVLNGQFVEFANDAYGRLFLKNAESDMCLMSTMQKWLDCADQHYRSIPSHAEKFHLLNKHKFLLPAVTTEEEAEWVSTRLAKAVSDREKKEVSIGDMWNAALLEHSAAFAKFAEHVITISDIRNGNLIKRLDECYPGIGATCSQEFYDSWLALQ